MNEPGPEQSPDFRRRLGAVDDLRVSGDLAAARLACGKLMAESPGNSQAMRLMAIIAADEGKPSEAGRLLLHIAERNPESIQAVSDLGRFHAELGQFSQAQTWFERAVELDAGNAARRFELANALFITGQPRDSLVEYEEGLRAVPDSPVGRIGKARALRSLGQVDEAVAVYRKNIGDGIRAGESYWSLSSLRTVEFDEAEIADMLRRRDEKDTAEGVFLDFALGKAFDDRGEFDKAWAHYRAGNEARRMQVYYDGTKFETEIDGIVETLDQGLLDSLKWTREPAVTPVFVVGMPRSGSTLVEQILASHSQVEALGELPFMAGLGRRYLVAGADGTEPAVAGLTVERARQLGEQYLGATERHRSGKTFFIDKLPDNFRNAGLIRALLPNAKIIDVRRDPIDTCVGNYRQWFASGKEFSYDLGELAEYHLQYQRVMRHWDAIMPGDIHRTQYEDLVLNSEQEIRSLLQYCGLPWEDACLEFHRTDRAVLTASSEQVRQPLYTGAIGFWKNYEAHLDELIDALAIETS